LCGEAQIAADSPHSLDGLVERRLLPGSGLKRAGNMSVQVPEGLVLVGGDLA